MTLPYETIVAQLVGMNVPREKAEAQARRELGLESGPAPRSAEVTAAVPARVELASRITVRLPWSVMVSDNEKDVAVAAGKKILTTEYRAAKKRARELAVEQITAPPYKCPVALVARVWEPNRSKKRDLTNWAKITHDALVGIAFEDDAQIDDVRWIRAGVDIDGPRVEFTITPLLVAA